MMYLWNVRPGLPASFSAASNWTETADPLFTGTASTIESGGIALAASDVALGMSVGQSNTLDLWDAGTTLSAGGLGVGIFGAGRVRVSNGATLQTRGTDGVDTIGYEAGGNGTVAIDGAGSCWTSESPFVNVGYEGVGVLDVVNGGALMMTGYLAIDAAVGGTALTTLVGAASSVIASAGVIADGGAGRLRIFTGATLTSGGLADQIGGSAGAGRASISGPGATWIESAGLLLVAAPALQSTLMVSDGGRLLIGTELQVGDAGMSGDVDVRAGGTVLVRYASQNQFFAVAVGVGAASAGTISVEGIGATLDTMGNPLLLGQQGSGTLIVGAGGNVSIGISNDTQIDAAAAVDIGESAGGSGVLAIGGIGARLTVNGGGFAGSGGLGTITVADKGILVAGDVAAIPGGFGLDIGAGAPPPGSTRIVAGGSATLAIGSGGTVIERNSFGVGLSGSSGSVSVADGVLAFSGQMIISGGSSGAAAGVGAVSVGAGGTIDAMGPTATAAIGFDGLPAISIGQGEYDNATGRGSLAVTGAGALVETGQYAIDIGSTDGTGTVGSGGAGALTVGAGGIVSAAGFVIGASPVASGLLAVGAGGSLATSGTILVGGAGTGTLSLMNGAWLAPGATVAIGATGNVQVAGAVDPSETIDFAAIGGTLNIQSPGDFRGEIVGFQSGDTLDITGLAAGSASLVTAGTVTMVTFGTGNVLAFVGNYGADGTGLAKLLGLSEPAQSSAITKSGPVDSPPSGIETVPIIRQAVTNEERMQFSGSPLPGDPNAPMVEMRAGSAVSSSPDIATDLNALSGTQTASDLLQFQIGMSVIESEIAKVSVLFGAMEAECRNTAALAASAMDFWRTSGA